MKKYIKAGVDWGYYNKPEFDEIDDLYLPMSGEGDTMASQIVTAVNKLVYKWYNDGDVFDNTRWLEGWANDLSSYANWLYTYVPEVKDILYRIYDCDTEDKYEELLKDLSDTILRKDILKTYEASPKIDSVYDCDGPFVFEEDRNDDDEEDYWEEEEEYEDEENEDETI